MLVRIRIGCRILWMRLRGVYRSLVPRVRFYSTIFLCFPDLGFSVTEMLLAILSICSEEELTEEDSSGEDEETRTLADAAMSPADYHQRRQQIKSKIMAVGRMQRVFQLLRYVYLSVLSGLISYVVTERNRKQRQSLWLRRMLQGYRVQVSV